MRKPIFLARAELFFVVCLALVAFSISAWSLITPASATGEKRSQTTAKGVTAVDKAKTPAKVSASEKSRDTYGRLPMSFEPNRGQTNKNVKFLARGQGYGLFLTPTSAVLALNKAALNPGDEPSARKQSSAVISLSLVGGASNPRLIGDDKLPGKVNYFVGNDQRKWRRDVPTYAKVRYANVYRGIDLVYYGNQQQLEYDFVVAPKANPRTIRLLFAGAEKMSINAEGDLLLHTPSGDVIQHKPIAYQEANGERHQVTASYRLEGNTVSFEIGNYDKSRRLIIDPVVLYSTYLGGGAGDFGLAVTVDAQGNAFLTGNTFSINFPLAAPFQATNQGGLEDVFVTKLNQAGTALVYSTYLGGTGGDSANSIAVDAQGNAYVAGLTTSDDFPITAGSLQVTKDLVSDAFVTKLNPSGSALVYSTYLGGDNLDQIFGLAVSADGRAYVAGRTDSTRLAATPLQRHGNPAFKSLNGGASWSPSATGLTASNVIAFASHPANSNLIYAGTTNGVFKSSDGGASWSVTGTDNVATAPEFTTSLVVDPSDPNVIYVGTLEGGVHKSTNGGGLYAFKNDGFPALVVNALAIDPLNPATLYAATVFGMFKTTNGGDTWVDISNGIINVVVNELAIDPTNPNIVYAGTRSGMYKTTNGGGLWFPINEGPISGGIQISVLTIDPLNPAILYAAQTFGSAQIFKTTNGGTTWISLTNGLPPAVVTAIAVDPVTSSTLYAGTAGRGIYKSTDSGASWTESNAGLSNMSVSALLVDRNTPATVYAGTLIGGDAFAARLNPSGSALDQLMSFGGDENDEARGVAIDSTGLPYIVGSTSSTNFPLANAFQSTIGGFADAFAAKLNATGSGFVYSTYLGGDGTDQGRAIAVSGGAAYVVGQTSSTNFPTANPFQAALSSPSTDAFVTKLNPSGSALDFSSYLGGDFGDQAFGVAVDAGGNTLITGLTNSTNFPSIEPTQATRGGSSDAFVTRVNASGSSITFSTYLGGSAADQGNGIALDQNGNAYIIGTTSSSNFPTINPFQGTRAGSSDVFVTKLGFPTDPHIRFTAAQYISVESGARVQVEVIRTGATSAQASVDYATSDTAGLTNCNVVNGIASARCDYATVVGRLSFAAGESTKTISIAIVDDAYAEGSENFTITLTNAIGVPLGIPTTATVTINDNETVNGANPIDQTPFFVRQQYVDFLGREPDPAGAAAWEAVINNCPAGDTTCDRIHVSSAFFRSAEFQGRGYFIYRFYPVAFGRKPDFVEFIPDLAKVSGFLSDAELEAAKVAFIAEFMSRPAFVTKFNGLNDTQYVDTLLATAQVTSPHRDFWIAALGNGTRTRATVLRDITESLEVYNKYYNQAFVVMQYFGYLRRDPDALYLDWIQVLDTTGDFRGMVNGFMNSAEYRFRFGP